MMKKHLLIAILSLIVCTASAQKLTSGDYTVTISNVKTENNTITAYGKKYDSKEYSGNYTIEKGGIVIASQKFSTLQLSEDFIDVNIKEDERSGNTLSYDFNSKKFEFAGDEYKAKSTKSTENIILSAILVYAQWLDSGE